MVSSHRWWPRSRPYFAPHHGWPTKSRVAVRMECEHDGIWRPGPKGNSFFLDMRQLFSTHLAALVKVTHIFPKIFLSKATFSPSTRRIPTIRPTSNKLPTRCAIIRTRITCQQSDNATCAVFSWEISTCLAPLKDAQRRTLTNVVDVVVIQNVYLND